MKYRQPKYAMFPTEEYIDRVERARVNMDQNGINALILTAKENALYFSGIQTTAWNSKHRPTAIIIPLSNDKPVYSVISENIIDVSRQTSWIDNVRPWGGWRIKDAAPDPITAILSVCQDMGVLNGTVGLELGYGQRIGMSQEDYEKLRIGLSNANIVDVGTVMWDLRVIKSQHEVEAMRKVCDATTWGFEKGFTSIQPGMTERELAGIIISEMSLQTNEMPGFVNIRSGQEKYGMMNVLPFDKPMEIGDLIVVDAGAHYKHYWADFMRMACIGDPTEQQRRFFDIDRAAMRAGIEMIKPGIKMHEIFDACYKVLIEGELEEHVGNLERIGHSVGLDIHEPPSIAKGSEVIVQPNMVLSVEPIFWDKPDHLIGNFAMEEMVLVTEDGYEILSTFSNELHLIPY